MPPKPVLLPDLQELWRPSPDFIGPLMPPMLLWFARGCPKSAWEIAAEERALSWSGRQLEMFEAAR